MILFARYTDFESDEALCFGAEHAVDRVVQIDDIGDLRDIRNELGVKFFKAEEITVGEAEKLIN